VTEMSVANAKGMSASEAIRRARQYFDEFYFDQVIENVLLEELDFDEASGNWLVTIGFDIGRKKIRQPSQNTLASLFAEQEVLPIREARKFVISDAGGGLIRMEDV
jgi:hypothetical protein